MNVLLLSILLCLRLSNAAPATSPEVQAGSDDQIQSLGRREDALQAFRQASQAFTDATADFAVKDAQANGTAAVAEVYQSQLARLQQKADICALDRDALLKDYEASRTARRAERRRSTAANAAAIDAIALNQTTADALLLARQQAAQSRIVLRDANDKLKAATQVASDTQVAKSNAQQSYDKNKAISDAFMAQLAGKKKKLADAIAAERDARSKMEDAKTQADANVPIRALELQKAKDKTDQQTQSLTQQIADKNDLLAKRNASIDDTTANLNYSQSLVKPTADALAAKLALLTAAQVAQTAAETDLQTKKDALAKAMSDPAQQLWQAANDAVTAAKASLDSATSTELLAGMTLQQGQNYVQAIQDRITAAAAGPNAAASVPDQALTLAQAAYDRAKAEQDLATANANRATADVQALNDKISLTQQALAAWKDVPTKRAALEAARAAR